MQIHPALDLVTSTDTLEPGELLEQSSVPQTASQLPVSTPFHPQRHFVLESLKVKAEVRPRCSTVSLHR